MITRLVLLATVACAFLTGNAMAQAEKADTESLSTETADQWAKLVLKGVDTEFPNQLSLVYSNSDQIGRPRDHFPAFYGCYDWHSSVHGHWVLVRLLKRYPTIESAKEVRAILSRHLTKDNLRQEAEFFAKEEQKTFERMYGWAWLFRLVHLVGLNLNRAWCMRAVAAALPEQHPQKTHLSTSAAAHLKTGLAYINSGHYEGDHWLATFGLYALEMPQNQSEGH